MGANKDMEVGTEMGGQGSIFLPYLPCLPGPGGRRAEGHPPCAPAPPAGRILLNFLSELGLVGAEGV